MLYLSAIQSVIPMVDYGQTKVCTQFVKPDESGNLFLGLGGFCIVKILLACLGAYLEPSRMFAVLVETECYGADVIKSVISGSRYSRARTAHSMIYEVLMSMMLEGFLSKFPEKRMKLEALQLKFQSKELSSEEWKSKKEQCSTIEAVFQAYVKERASLSQSFILVTGTHYVSDLFPIIRDSTNSLRSGDWIL